jgi:hypothetical protein
VKKSLTLEKRVKFNTDPNGVEYPYTLTANGDYGDNFSLCKFSTSEAYVIIYNATEAGSKGAYFDWTSCTAVYIHMLPVSQ